MSAGPCLQLDLGNSRLKWRLVEHGRVLGRGAAAPGDDRWLSVQPVPRALQVASVAGEAAEQTLARRARERWGLPPWFARSGARAGDLVNSYPDPAVMGVDRWLAMLAGRARCAGRLCVVDAGSALTIDLVAADGRHEGGYIIPGASLMERALRLDTERVRFPAPGDVALMPGQSTAACVHNGIAIAQVGALRRVLEGAVAGGAAPTVLVTGGDGARLLALEPTLEATYLEDLVFEGLTVLARLEAGRDG